MNRDKLHVLKKFVASAGKRSGQLALSALIVGVVASTGIHSPEELVTMFGFTLPISKLLLSFVSLFGPDAFWKTVGGWGDKDSTSSEILDRLEKLELTRKLDDHQFRRGLSRILMNQQNLVQRVISESQVQTAAILLAQFESFELIHKEQLESIKAHVSQGVILVLEELEKKYGALRHDNQALSKLLGIGIQHIEQELSNLKEVLEEIDNHIQVLGGPLANQDTSHDPLFWETKKAGPVTWLWGAPLINQEVNVNRTDLLMEIKNTLLKPKDGEENRSGQNTVLMVGMGGTGKTYAARSLWEDDEVQKRFPDGVLWASVGRQPNIGSTLKEWVSVLGGKMRVMSPSLDQYRETLRLLLKDRACLLIVDDIWEAKHLQSFFVEGEKCCLLATSRNRRIADELSIGFINIPTMKNQEGIELLEKWAGKNLEDTSLKSKEKIIAMLENLPKAIQLAGAHMGHTSPDEWIENFSNIRDLDLEWDSADPDKSLAATFKVSMDALEAQKRELFAVLGIFPEGEEIPDEPIFLLWHSLVKRITPLQVQNLIKELIDKALIEQTGIEPLQIKLHDLLHDLVLEVLGSKASGYHKALLSAYSETKTGGGWHTAADDGYLYNHLVFHLKNAGEEDEIKALFENDTWLQARSRTGDFLYEGYARDLHQVWKISHNQLINQIAQGETAQALSDVCVTLSSAQVSIH